MVAVKRVTLKWSAAFALVGASTCGVFSTDSGPQLTLFECTPPFRSMALGQVMPVGCSVGWDKGEAGGSAAWSSSNPSVLSVSPATQFGPFAAEITAVAPGTAVITATYEGRTSSATVNVLASGGPTLRLLPNPALMAVGGRLANAKGQYELEMIVIDGDGLPPPTATGGCCAAVVTSSQPSVVQQVTETITNSGGWGDQEISMTIIKAFSPGSSTLTYELAGISGSTVVSVVTGTDIGLAPVIAGITYGTEVGASTIAFDYTTGGGDAQQRWTETFSATAGTTTFHIALPSNPADSIAVEFDRDWTTPRPFHSVRRGYHVANVPDTIRPLLIARSVDIKSGTYTGTKKATSLDAAFTRPCTETGASCESFYPQNWEGGPRLWPGVSPHAAVADVIRIPLAIDHGASNASPTAADSTAFWGFARNLELDLGASIFRPVNRAELPAADAAGFATGGILLIVDMTAATPVTQVLTNAQGDVVAATIRLNRSDLTTSRFATRELLHALGFGNSCAWVSVTGLTPCTGSDRATADDAAAFALAYYIRDAIVSGRPTTTVGDALRGQRRLELGLVNP